MCQESSECAAGAAGQTPEWGPLCWAARDWRGTAAVPSCPGPHGRSGACTKLSLLRREEGWCVWRGSGRLAVLLGLCGQALHPEHAHTPKCLGTHWPDELSWAGEAVGATESTGSGTTPGQTRVLARSLSAV